MYKSIKNILISAGSLREGDKVLVLYDASTEDVANMFKKETKEITRYVKSNELPVYIHHGKEPSDHIVDEMLRSHLIICLTKNSLAHSRARLKANKAGVKFLSLPDYSVNMLSDESLMVDFKKFLFEVEKLADYYTQGNNVRITSSKGTDLYMDIGGRRGNCCPGFVNDYYKLGSPPDVEANVAPVENKSKGTIVIDGSITCDEIGLLESPVILELEEGRIKNFISQNKKYVEILNNMFNTEAKRILAELGVGFNDKAKLCGNMLIDEGVAGFVHFGFGSNSTIGGKNNISFHLDFVMTSATLYIDEEVIIKDGSLLV